MSWRARCEELARQLDFVSEDVIERWAERAAIREHDGGQARAEAEAAAFEDVRAELERTRRIAEPRRGPRSMDDVAPAESRRPSAVSRKPIA